MLYNVINGAITVSDKYANYLSYRLNMIWLSNKRKHKHR